MIFPDQKNGVATRPVYHYNGYVYKHFKPGDAFTLPEPDIFLDDNDFMIDGNRIETNGDGGLPIGRAISKVAQLSLTSKSWKYKPSDFIGATILLSVYYYDNAGEYQQVLNEFFIVSAVTVNYEAIQITAQDVLSMLDRPYKSSFHPNLLVYLSDIYEDIIKQTFPKLYAKPGVIENDYQILNGTLSTRAGIEGYTCRQVLEFIAQIACGNVYAASIDKGYVEIRTLSTAQPFNSLNQWMQIEDNAETITVSGLRTMQTKDDFGHDVDPPIEIKSTPFSDEYPVTINNPLIAGREGLYFSHMLPTLSALHFHKFKGKHIGYPLAEYGDYAVVTHRGGTFNTFLTNITWNISGATEFECNIATAAENAADYDNSNGTIAKVEEEEPTTQEFDKPAIFNNTATFNDAATFAGAVELNNNVEFHSEVEIYGDTPHIDFHHANSNSDYTSRIIENSAGAIDILAPNGIKLNGKRAGNQSVTLTANTDRITNVSYTAKYNELLGAVFVRIYGKINPNFAMTAGYGYTLFDIGSRVPNSNVALSVKIGTDDNTAITKKAAAYAKSTGVINIQPLDGDLNGYDVYITGFWFV